MAMSLAYQKLCKNMNEKGMAFENERGHGAWIGGSQITFAWLTTTWTRPRAGKSFQQCSPHQTIGALTCSVSREKGTL